ncbi:mating pheromone a PWA37_003319 [Arxiozyma heterogenica]
MQPTTVSTVSAAEKSKTSENKDNFRLPFSTTFCVIA